MTIIELVVSTLLMAISRYNSKLSGIVYVYHIVNIMIIFAIMIKCNNINELIFILVYPLSMMVSELMLFNKKKGRR